MSKAKLIALDLDGTTLTSEKKITPRTLRTIKTLRNLGHQVVIATGRPTRLSVDYHMQLELDTPIVNFNGALVHHMEIADFHYHSPIELQTVYDIFHDCVNIGVRNMVAEIKDHFYVHKLDDVFHAMMTTTSTHVEFQPRGIGNFPTLFTEDATSMLICPERDKFSQVYSHLSERYSTKIVHRSWGEPDYVIEVMRAGISKATGLAIIAEHFGISKEDIIAFGDEANDVEMISYAGTGVAMGNAVQAVIDVSDHVTLSNEEDGVAYFLERMFDISCE